MADKGNRAAPTNIGPPALADEVPAYWDRFCKRITIINAILIILFTLSAIIGWHIHQPALFQIHPDFAPMQYNTALCFLSCGVSLLLTGIAQRRLSIIAALPAAGLTTSVLLQHLLGSDLGISQLLIKVYATIHAPHSERMALLTAFALALSLTSLVSSGLNRPRRNTSAITAITAAIVIAVGLLGLLGYASGLTGAFSWEHISQMSLLTIGAFMTLGIGNLCIAWRDCIRSTGKQPPWLPIAVGVISLTTSFLLSGSLHRQERIHIRHFSEDNSMTIRAALISELEDRHHSIHRMAQRHADTHMPDKSAWENDAMERLQDHTGYRFIAWADENLLIRWSAPLSQTAYVNGLSILPPGWTREQLLDQFRVHGDQLGTQINLGGKSLSLLSPIKMDGMLKGCIVASLNEEKFFESIFSPKLAEGYFFTVSANGQILHARGDRPNPKQRDVIATQKFDHRGTDWVIELWPEPNSLRASDSLYSKVVLGLGILLSLVLGASGHFYQVANIKSLEATERNIRLQKEISERIRSQKELEKASALNNAIVTHSPYSVITTDTNGLITSFNPAAEKLLGYSAEELIGKHSPTIIHDLGEIISRSKLLSQRFQTQIQAGFEVFVAEAKRGLDSQFEWTYIRKDGHRIPVTLGVSSLTNPNGDISGYLGVAGDISDLKNTMKELKETHEKLMNASLQIGRAEIATNILHNVGNVLNSINVSSTLLAEKVRKSRISSVTKTAELLTEQPDLAEFFQSDRRGAELPGFLRKLSDQLTKEQQEILNDLSALDKNIHHIKDIVSMQQTYSKVSEIKEHITVQELIELSLNMHTGTLKKNHFKVHIDCDPSLIVDVEKHKVLQILVNLISNAKHACFAASTEEPVISIHASKSGNSCQIVIEDNGEGIPKENMTRIFNHGFTTKKDGHGFGLHSCAITAKEMQGSLVAESDGPGSGATFTLSFPIS